MEGAVGLGDKRVGREEGEDLGFGFASNAVPFQKLSRTAAFPSRMGGDFYDGSVRALQEQQQSVPTPFKSSGVGMGDNGGAAAVPMRAFPFTWAQWQELQRQALIYKHIMASVPVPPDLLFPIAARYFPSLSPSLVGGGGGGGFNLRFSNGTDPEPGRCRRTDGKKWRCSRDAAPDQKYCERHLHRGRPRSRKPVELRKTKPSPTTNSPSPSATALKFPFQSNKEPRYSDGMEGMASNQQWELNQQINLNYADLKHHCFPFLNPDLSSLENERDPPRRFIDAWSAENVAAAAANPNGSSSGPTGDKPGLSNLTLSVSTGGFDEGTDHIRMGLGLISDAGLKSHSSLNWMSSPSPLGGPLAEVLQSSNNSKSSGVDLINLMGKGCCRSATDHEVVSPQDSPTRLASSPSGVLQKALVSLSDSSSSSSPTFAAASRAEVAFQWMNQGS